jgi:hypothetical protein
MDPPIMVNSPRPYSHALTMTTMNMLIALSDLRRLPGGASSRKEEKFRHSDTMVEFHPLTPDRWGRGRVVNPGEPEVTCGE